MRQRRDFPGLPASVAASRRFAAAALRGSDAMALESIELMVSELATNCIRHAGVGFELAIERRAGEIRVEVRDSGSGEPQLRSPGPTDEGGRGLRIVEMLASTWGVEPGRRAGKTVWFTVKDPAARADCRDRAKTAGGAASGGRSTGGPCRPAGRRGTLLAQSAAAPVRSVRLASSASPNSERTFSAAPRS